MRLTRVIASVTVAACCLAPSVAHAADPSATPSTGAPAITVPSAAVPDPLSIAPSVVTELTALAMRYESNLSVAEERRAEAAEKEKDAAHQREIASEYIAQVVDYAMSPSADPFSQKLLALGAAETPEELITGMFSTEQVTDAQEGHLVDAKAAFDAAQVLTDEANKLIDQAKVAEAAAQRQLKDVHKLAKELGLGSSSTPDGLPATHAEQVQWNTDASNDWKAYVEQLSSLGVKVPKAAELKSDGGYTSATVGSKTVEVLPAETIAFVNAMFARIGNDYAPKNLAGAWSCGGLATGTGGYQLAGTPAELYAKTVKVKVGDIRTGDLVFSANKAAGIHHVGVYVGKNMVIDSAATRYQVGVSKMPTKPFAVTRPALGAGTNTAPKAKSGATNTVCNATKPVAGNMQGWTFPLKRGTYNISAGFGQAGGMWKANHTGQDLSAAIGTPIFASRGGTVALAEVGWAGTLITVNHPDGTAERYAHSSKVLVQDGQQVASGEQIALVGARGNTTGPHLHFELTVNGEFVDPMPVLVQFLANSGAGTGWGGYGNGQIPQGVLCPAGDVLLRCDVAGRANTLAQEFKTKFGTPLELTVGYRDIVGQIQRGPNGTLKDIPGTSSFGWGTQFSLGELSAKQSAWVARRAAGLGLSAQEPGTWARNA